MIKTNVNYYDLNYKILEHEAIIVMTYYLPQRFEIFHIYSHQELQTGTTKLNLPQKLNELADTVVKRFERILNIPFASIAVYFNNAYIPNNYQHHIHHLAYQSIVNYFTKRTNN